MKNKFIFDGCYLHIRIRSMINSCDGIKEMNPFITITGGELFKQNFINVAMKEKYHAKKSFTDVPFSFQY